jgi:hypothetical protein
MNRFTVVSGKDKKMESYNRITLFLTISALLILSFLPCTFAQNNNRGTRRGGTEEEARFGMSIDSGPARGGGGGGRGARRDPSRGERVRGFLRDDLTDEQIDRVLENYSRRDPTQAENLKEHRKELDKESFLKELQFNAFIEYATELREERERTERLEWLKKYVPEEAKDIEAAKDESFELFSKKLQTAYLKYREIIEAFPPHSEALIPVLVSDLQLRNELLDLGRRYIFTPITDTDAREKLETRITEIIGQRYDLEVRQKEIKLDQVKSEVETLKNLITSKENEIKSDKEEEVRSDAIQRDVDRILNPRGFRGGGGRGRP